MLVTPRELSHLKLIEQITKRKIERKPIPTVSEAIEGQQRLAVEKLMQAVGEGDTLQYKELAEGLLESTDSVTLLSAALKLLTREPDTTPVRLTEEGPLRIKNPRNDRHEQPGFRRKREGKVGRPQHKRPKQSKRIS